MLSPSFMTRKGSIRLRFLWPATVCITLIVIHGEAEGSGKTGFLEREGEEESNEVVMMSQLRRTVSMLEDFKIVDRQYI